MINKGRYEVRGTRYEWKRQPSYLVPRISCLLLRISCLLLLLACSNVHGQSYPNGFYFTLPCSQFVQKPMTVFLAEKEEEQVCITQQPVVVLEALDSIGDLLEIPKKNYVSFEFKLTRETTMKLYKVFTTMSSGRFAFVIENEVAFVFEVDGTKFNQLISVSGSLRAGRVQAFHQRLLDLFASGKENN
jgi:hypothetical protein